MVLVNLQMFVWDAGKKNWNVDTATSQEVRTED
jgi:hypothetical protein